MSDTEVTMPGAVSEIGDRTTTSRSIEWYAEGDSRRVAIGGIEVVVKFIGRKGRRARIAIVAPASALFCGCDTQPMSSFLDTMKRTDGDCKVS